MAQRITSAAAAEEAIYHRQAQNRINLTSPPWRGTLAILTSITALDTIWKNWNVPQEP
jgi:hypothetical protein